MATILGLLLVVTFIATFLTTTLPNQMSVNDLNHETQVSNQVGQLQAVLTQLAGASKPGAEVSQPVALGSAGLPPFAAQDGASLSSQVNGANSTVSYALAGPSGFYPPTGFGAHQYPLPPASGCTFTSPTNLTCGGFNSQYYLKWNFSAGNNKIYTVSLQGGSSFVGLNFSTNGSSITISGLQGFHVFLTLYGSHNTLNPQGSGGSTPITINVTGNYNTINLAGLTAGGNTVKVNVVGNNNVIDGPPSNAGGNHVYVSIVGTYNTLALTPGGGDYYYTYFTGFDAVNATSTFCPYGAEDFLNSLTGVTNAILNNKNAHLAQVYNNSTAFNNPSTKNPGTHWSITNQSVANFACPYVQSLQLPFSFSQSAILQVLLRNTYAPSAEVAYDQGAVVFAQVGGTPLMVDGPQIAYTGTTARLWVPAFVGTPGTTAGVATVDVFLRLVSVQSYSLPQGIIGLSSPGTLNIVVNTPYAAAWMNYFSNQPAFSGRVTCAPAASGACVGPYASGNHIGTVTIALPTSGLTSFTIQVAQFAIAYN